LDWGSAGFGRGCLESAWYWDFRRLRAGRVLSCVDAFPLRGAAGSLRTSPDNLLTDGADNRKVGRREGRSWGRHWRCAASDLGASLSGLANRAPA
jgi:hypothetical protein